MKRMVVSSKIAYWAGVAVILAAIYLLTQWITASIVATSNGPIEWADGFDDVKCYWLQCD